MKIRTVRGVRYRMFDTIQECAAKAAIVFAERRWDWGDGVVPDADKIEEHLRMLWTYGTQGHKTAKGTFMPPTDFCQSARLLYTKGQFGYEISG